MAKVLIVDDTINAADNLARILRISGHDTIPTYSERDATALLDMDTFDILVLDIWMEHRYSGINLLKYAKTLNPSPVVIILTAYLNEATIILAMQEGAYDYVEKTTEVIDGKDTFDIIREKIEHINVEKAKSKQDTNKESAKDTQEGLLRSAGAWKGLVDTEKLIEDIYNDRSSSDN